MNEIDLDLDLNNELEFKISVEGTKPAQASCRLIFENSNFDISFTGKMTGDNRAIVNVPPLENIIEEGTKKATLEMIVDDRLFKPLTLSVNFKKSIKVFAEAVVKETAFQKPKASAVLVTKTVPKEKVVENIEQVINDDADKIIENIKPDWPVESSTKNTSTQKIIENKLSNLTEDDLRDKIRTLLIAKRK
jgi:hypothetical protein|tara:strand:- start:1042 stop:1614 length:573 start_codon:yes stop_codon:yes gene_type:complete